MKTRAEFRRVRSIAAVAWIGAAVGFQGLSVEPAGAQGTQPPATPAEMVATYNALADVILGAKDTEENLVRSILAATIAHAQVELARARQAIQSNDAKTARSALENLAAAVAQLATEGDNAVAGIRKRLVEGGHHHNAVGEQQGVFDEGYVVVTKVAKQALLDSSKAIGKLAQAPKAEALDAEWTKVQAAYSSITK